MRAWRGSLLTIYMCIKTTPAHSFHEQNSHIALEGKPPERAVCSSCYIVPPVYSSANLSTAG